MTKYGLQLYSITDATDADVKGAIEKVASIGYKYVETAGFYGLKADELAAIVKGAGLKVSGGHIGFDQVENNFAGIVEYLHTLECDNYIVPWANWKDEFAHNIELLNKFQPLLAKEGIKLHFHNHADEFLPLGPNGESAVEAILKETDVKLEIDTYWAFVGGADPVKFITDNKDRIEFIHLKDGSPDGNGTTLGRGKAPVLKVREAAEALGFTMVVESENQNPDGITEVTECFEFLKANA